MLRIFIFGILLGIAAAAGALYAYPAVDQHREASIVTVAANGGNIESFHVNVPMDRIMVGAQDRKRPLPPGMQYLMKSSSPMFGLNSSRYATREIS